MIYLSIFFFVLAGFSEAIMDTLQFHYYKSIFRNLKKEQFWNPETSWLNKYKNNNPEMGEKFLGSTTIFVGFTDAWHLFKLTRNLFIFIGIFFMSINHFSVETALFYTIINRVFFGISFSAGYKFFSLKIILNGSQKR